MDQPGSPRPRSRRRQGLVRRMKGLDRPTLVAGKAAELCLTAAGSAGILRSGGERVSECVGKKALSGLRPFVATGALLGSAESPFPPRGLKAGGGARALGAHAQFPVGSPLWVSGRFQLAWDSPLFSRGHSARPGPPAGVRL